MLSISASSGRTESSAPLRPFTVPTASTVRRDVGIAPYGYFEGWCRRADVGIAPYGAFNGRCA